MTNEWKLFDTAPRDGTSFDAWVASDFGGWRVVNLHFRRNGMLYREGESIPIELPRWPTHWMPLPSGPAQ